MRCRLSLLTNSALVIRVQMRGEGGSCGVSANEYSCAHHVTWSPNKLWRSTSIFNLWFMFYHVERVQLSGKTTYKSTSSPADHIDVSNYNTSADLLMFRYIYDLTEQDSSRSREIERVMREARLRELCKVNADYKCRL
jgi:hypothetical protein